MLGAVACRAAALARVVAAGVLIGAGDPRARERDRPAAAAGASAVWRGPRRGGRSCWSSARGADRRAVDDPQRGRARRTSCRSRPSSGPRWRAPTTARRARTGEPGVVAVVEARRRLPADLRPDPRRPTRRCSRSSCARRRWSSSGAPGRTCATVAFWTTRRMLDLAGMDWSIHTASTISADARAGDRGRDLLLDLRAAGAVGAFTRRARAAPLWFWAVPLLMYLSVVFLVVETPRYRHRDRSVHRAAGRAGAHAQMA